MKRLAFAAAPACLFLYGIFWLLDWGQGFHGPGVFWDIGHVFFLLAFVAFLFVVWSLRERVGGGGAGRIALASAVVASVGIAIFLRVGVIDLVTGFLASDHAAMEPISRRLNAWPDARLMRFFRLGPVLFQAGMMALLVQLTVMRRLPWWTMWLVLSGFLLIGFDLRCLMPGAILIGVGFAPLVRDSVGRR